MTTNADLIYPVKWFGQGNPKFLQNYMNDWWANHPDKGFMSYDDVSEYFADYGQIVYVNDSEFTFEFKDTETLTWFVMNWS